MNLKDVMHELQFGQINEAGLSRLLSKADTNDFCIVTAFRYGNSLKANRAKNQEIFSMLSSQKMSGYKLIGHWQEAPDGVEFQDASPDQLTDSVEESVMFIRRADLEQDKFIELCVSLCKKFNQDAVIVGLVGDGVYLYFKDGTRQKIGTKLTLGKTGQAYSQMRNKNNVPFVFEGIAHPTSNISRQVFVAHNIGYLK